MPQTVKLVYLCSRIMKRLRYILVAVLSLLIIYAGVGVSICSCMTCEKACVCCATPCDTCHESDQQTSSESCEDGVCTVSIYKMNLAQQASASCVSVPSFELFCGLLPAFQAALFHGDIVEVPYVVPPNPDSSRHYLALYSVFLI